MTFKNEMLYMAGVHYELSEEGGDVVRASEGEYHETAEDVENSLPKIAIKYYNAIREKSKTASMSSFRNTVNTAEKREKIMESLPWLRSAVKKVPSFWSKVGDELLKIEKMGLKEYKMHYSSRLVK